MQTNVYRRQHAEIRRLLEKTGGSLVPLDADACRSMLGRLAAMLNVHLGMEDRALYPRLMTHDDPLVREIAMEYRLNMGQLAAVFEAFAKKWGGGGAIEASPEHFARAHHAIAQALTQRMDMEDANLFALVERGRAEPAS